MKTKIIQEKKLPDFIKSLVDKGIKVIAPVKRENLVVFDNVSSFDEISLNQVNTKKSVKEYFFAECETVCKYKIEKKDVKLEDVEKVSVPTVIFGSRPCDAASLPILDEVFKWDYEDKFYFDRREATTIVSISCLDCAEDCFCTAVESDPGNTAGSDLLFTNIGDGKFLVEVITEKGKKLVDSMSGFFEEGSGDKDSALKKVREKLGKKFELTEVKKWLDENFYSEFWKNRFNICIGCGTCTFLCPTCHCFDIQDETTPTTGRRVKNWDACQFKLFTLHASGHNPRNYQYERQRQRIMHKFKYYKDKFNKTLCVGCGRCITYCPVDLSLLQSLQMIDKESKVPAK